MPKYRITVAEHWVKYHEVDVEAPSQYDAESWAALKFEDDSDVDFDLAVEAGLDYTNMDVIDTVELPSL